MRLVCISDTHNRGGFPPLPEGDVLVHAGDATGRGTIAEISQFNAWIGKQKFKHKVIIAGNHDFCFQTDPGLAKSIITEAIYLQDEMVEIEGAKFYGSPWQPWFHNWAFNLPRKGPELQRRWEQIPTGVDVLITHGPPYGILDQTQSGEHVGCELLRKELHRIRPKVHVFGHIHEAYGQHYEDGIQYVNAAMCDLSYKATQLPIVIDLLL